MKILIAVALAALVTYANAACSDIVNCNTCSNPGPKCEECPDGTIMTINREECKTCGTGCEECTIDSLDQTTCVECDEGYYLKDGACVFCGDGCNVCHEDVDGNIDCDECEEYNWVRKVPETGPATCESCPTASCKSCSIESDGTTVRCNACWDYKDMNMRGYFLKTSDKTCGACPSNCEKCSDDGEGKGICNSCFDSYVLLSDSTQETLVDGEKCLKCPTGCSECSGEMFSSSTAKCTACNADEGLYLSDDECISCGTGCKSCDSDGACTDCNEDYRLSDGGCILCPAFCKTCSVNEDTSEDECSVCDEKYGPKAESSRTCDSCGFANCGSCTRSSSGTFTCNNCKDGYIMNSAKTQCVKCPDGCDTCTYDDTLNGGSARCTSCSDGYTDNEDSYDGTCGECPSDCDTCVFLDDGTGNFTNPINCTACTDTTAFHIGSYNYPAVCVANIDFCTKGHNFVEEKCETYSDCEDGYKSEQDCTECEVGNCADCNTGRTQDPAQCDTCMDGFVLDTDNSNEECLECVVNDCKTCTLANYEDECETCVDGYKRTSDKSECIKCPNFCTECSVSGTTSSCTTCQQYDATAGTKQYVKDGDGGCKSCGNKCIDCSWDSTNSAPICSDCESGYKVNGNDECEECPANCDDCEWDSTEGMMACKSSDCATGYGRKTDLLCHACPDKCDSCTLGDAEVVGDDVLICDSNGCADGYAKNDDVCAKCPPNCATCSDNGGTMECTECMDGYDLYSADKTCQKCPTKCVSCSAGSTVTCNECEDGYALAADKASCVDCGTAAFENCAECTNIDSSGKANCTECDDGFTLQDEEEYLSCVDASFLLCGDGDIFDNGPECSACADTFTLEDYICIQQCYACGDVDEGVYVEMSECMIPSGNATENDATLVSCPSGICYGAVKDGKIMAGCLPEDDATGTCVGDRAAGEICSETESASLCERCCSGEKCNTYLQELDGLSDSAVSIAANFAMLVFAAVMAAMRF